MNDFSQCLEEAMFIASESYSGSSYAAGFSGGCDEIAPAESTTEPQPLAA